MTDLRSAILLLCIPMVSALAVLDISALFLAVCVWGVTHAAAGWLRAPIDYWLVFAGCVFVVAVALVLYLSQLLLLPEFLGFTGPEGGIGTDDTYFYSQSTPYLPEKLPVRGDYFAAVYDYSRALGFLLGAFEKFFGYAAPLQVIVVNCLAVTLLFVLTASLAASLGATKSVQLKAALLVLFCPFVLSNGAVLLREVWLAVALVGSVLAVLDRRIVLLLASLVIAFFARFESFMLILGNLGILSFFLSVSRSRNLRDSQGLLSEFDVRPSVMAGWGALALIMVLVLVVYWQQFAIILGKAALGRPDFVAGFLAESAQSKNGDSTLTTIASLPIYLSIPIGFLFFLGAPFLNLNLLVVDGVFVPRYLMQNGFAVLNAFVLPYFAFVVFDRRTWRQPVVLALLAIFVIDTILVAQFSLQIRHKVMLLPLFYLLCAMGMERRPQTASLVFVAYGAVILLGVITLLINIRNLSVLA